MRKSPEFIGLFIDSVRMDYSSGGVKRLIPVWLFLSIAGSFTVSFNIPLKNGSINVDTMIKIVAALITAQGIILAMSMQTCGTILSNISQGNFSAYLKSAGLLSYYMLLVQLIQGIHLTSLLMLLGSAIVLLLDSYFEPVLFRIVFAVGLGMFLYALRWSWGMTIVVRDLIYWRSEYEYDNELQRSPSDSRRTHTQ